MKQVKEMFEQVHMSPETESRIRQALEQKKTPRRLPGRALAMAAALAVIVMLTPPVRAAVSGWVVKYFWPDSDITIYETVDANGEAVAVAGVDTGAPAFARMVNGRLYFLGNGEKIDITEQITEENPYFYTHVDDYGLTHYMAVGYSGSVDNYGIYEFIRDENTGEWVTGTGRNFMDPETETRYPWVELVWEHYQIPWPLPE